MNQTTASSVIKFVAFLLMINTFIWASAAFPPYDGLARIYLDILTWPAGNATPVWEVNIQWLSAIGAGLLAAIAIFYYFVVSQAALEGNRNIINATIWAGIAWFIIDSAGSISVGFSPNAVINVITLIPLIGPLLVIKYDD